MGNAKIVKPFYDFEKKGIRETNFFFLEHVLKARADLNMESGRTEYDQEINVYLAGLLNSLIESNVFLTQKPYISAFDTDIRTWLENHPGLRNEYMVYRDNADFGLVFLGLFLGHKHQGSYQQTVMAETDENGRVALYYELAASALAHLQGNTISLVSVFQALADNMTDILQILRRTANTYFDMMEKISEGSLYHLEKELDNLEARKFYNSKLDLFLKTYAKYKETPSNELKKQVMEIADELSKMNEKFKFDKTSL